MSTDVLIVETLSNSPSGELADGLNESFAPQGYGAPTREESKDESVKSIAQSQVSTSVLRDYVQLTKPRIVVMILVTTMLTALIGAGSLVSVGSLALLMLATGMVAASAGAANQIWERTIDRRMARTATRPLPAQRLGIVGASLFTAALGIGGAAMLASYFGAAPAIASIATWLLYVLVYTPMKTRTSFNTTVGAVAGALPVLIGYTATGGGAFDWTGWLLVGVLVAWQYPHFMAIAWMYRHQYDQAGFKMTTTVEPTGRSAGIQSVIGSVAIVVCGIALAWIPGGVIMPSLASVLIVICCYPMLRASLRFLTEPNDGLARKLLRSSLLVLPTVLFVVTLRVFF